MQRSKRDIQIALMLVGIAVGWLSMSVYAQGSREPPPQAVSIAG